MKQNELLLFVVSIFIVVVAWIGFNLYHAHTTSTITDIQNKQIQPITADFDMNVVNQVKTRAQITPKDIAPGGSASNATASNSATETPSPTISPRLTGTGQASSAGSVTP